MKHYQLNRPQTPQGPFPYSTEEVSFTNGSATLRGTLTLPEGAGVATTGAGSAAAGAGSAAAGAGALADIPVVIMVTGSGLQNRDEEIFEHKPFAVIADALARHGIASLRYDDRGFGESTGDLINVTTQDLKNDALAGIELLRQRFTTVGILGHSEGGTIALMLAAEGKVDFAISLAGMTVSGKETLLWQNRLTLTGLGYPESTVKAYLDALTAIFESSPTGAGSAAAGAESLPAGTAGAESLPAGTGGAESLAAGAAGLPAELQQNLRAVAAQMATPYLQQFVTLDISDRLSEITCPVLALNGTKDMQVECSRNLGAIRNGRAVVKAMDGLNHLFQHCTTGSPAEYRNIEETISPEVLDIITDWIPTVQLLNTH